MIWKPVPVESRHGIIVQYTIHYKEVKKESQKEGTMTVKEPVLRAFINGLRQKAEYTFWIVAATSKGSGPVSNAVTATTEGKMNEKDTMEASVNINFNNKTVKSDSTK